MTRPFLTNSPSWLKLAILIGLFFLVSTILFLGIELFFQYFFDFQFFAYNEIIVQLTEMSRGTGLSPDEAAKYGYELLPQYVPNYQHVEYAKWYLILSSQLPILITGILYLWIVYKEPTKVLSENKANWKMYVLATLLFFLIMPLVGFIGEWNQNIYIPFPSLQNYLLDSEIKSGIYTLSFTDMNSTGELLIMIFFIGIITAIAEELVFRAGLQNILVQTKMNPHIAIWLGATLFSIMHFQFYGFFVRLLLGVLLGYLYYWSKDIRTSIIAHAFNNSLAMILAYNIGKINDELPDESNYIVLIPSAVLAAAVIWGINKLRTTNLTSLRQ
ncbi:MAG: type II CAAX endopeptidase family protein [Bacteroidetes bacterium]|nr:type II CAAX endopeptidase family protein [Bacteroidota bacterium]